MIDHKINMNQNEDGGTSVLDRVDVRLPKKYKVLLHNDDYTTMEFVIFVLQSVFHKNLEAAEKIMMEVHVNGVGVCGVYTYEIAETKVQKVLSLAKDHMHPLICTYEPE